MIDQRLFDDVLSHALDILRLSATEKAKVVARLLAMQEELAKQLQQANVSEADQAQIKTVIQNANTYVQQTYTQVQGSLDLGTIAELAAHNTAQSLTVVLGKDALKVPLKDYAASVASDVLIQGAPSAEWWSRQADDVVFKFAQAVRQGLQAGETNGQIIARIVGKGTEPGVLNVTRQNAAALVQTSVQTVANDARRSTFKANSDVIEGIEQISTLDSHTTLTCIAYDHQQWNLDFEPINGSVLPYNGGCPRHWNCRSVEVPLLKSFRSLGLNIPEKPVSTRASDIGQISANTDFDAFLKRKGTEFQDEVLGPGRAELWRSGKITLRDLVSGDGSPATLEELRRKAGLA